MALQFTRQDIYREFHRQTLESGHKVWESGLVQRADVSEDGSRVAAAVTGTARRPYGQTITIKRQADRVQFVGHCSCPMQLNCKHVVAVLFECLEREKELQRQDGDGPQLERSLTLTPEIAEWLERLASATASPAPKASSSQQRTLRYVLNHNDAPLSQSGSGAARIRALSMRVKKDGGFADVKSYDPEGVTRPKEQRARFIGEADVVILRDLLWLKRAASFNSPDIPLQADATSLRVLETLLKSERLHYGGLEGPVLRAGPPQAGGLSWVKTERGAQRLSFAPLGAGSEPGDGAAAANGAARFDAVLRLDPPHYADLERGVIGAIMTGLPPKLAAAAAMAPEISASQAIVVKELMKQRLSSQHPEADKAHSAALPLPETAGNVETRVFKPVPCLDFMTAEVRVEPSYLWYATAEHHRRPFRVPVARLSFDYGGERVDGDSQASMVERVEGDRLILTPRDAKAEQKAARRLEALGLEALDSLPFQCPAEHAGDLYPAPPDCWGAQDFLAAFDDPSRYIAFSAESVPLLVNEGWQVAFSDDYPYRIADGEAQWWADVGEGSGIDWFSFELGIEYEGHRINLVAQLSSILAQLPPDFIRLAAQPGGQDKFAELCRALNLYHQLPDGRLLPLPGARLAPILKALLEFIGPRSGALADGKARLHRADVPSLAAFADEMGAGVAWAANAERLIELGEKLRRASKPEPIALPDSFKAELRPYQSDGLAWLDFLRGAGFGGVLADDMGLGKTVQALAFLAREKAEGRLKKPALIVSPTSVLPNWQAEAERFTPELSVLPLRGVERRGMFAEIGKHDIVLTTYPLLARDHEVLLAEEFHVAILDEAQAIKNPKASIAMLAHRIDAAHRFALTGTPLENNLGEIWSLFEFLIPGLLGDERTFRRVFRTPIEKHNDAAAQAFLSRRLKPFMLRRTKEMVAKELPPKTEIVEHVRLEGAQRDLYETVRSLMHAKVRDEIAKKGLAKSHIVFLDALLKLRQICCDPRLLKMPQAKKVKASAKLDRLMEMIPELMDEGRRILLFSQFTSMLALVEEELQARKIPYVLLTGDTVDRAAPVRDFQSGKAPLFLLSLKAGGSGLNLTAADTVIHYDPWWNPAVEAQATDRAYRIGQDKPVFVYKLIVEEGVERAIEQLKARKAALAEALFDGCVKAPLDLTEADISALFAPLDKVPARRAA